MTSISPTRVGIISDTHGFLDPRIADVIAGCDIAIHAGDIMGQHVLAQLQPRRGEVIAVRGNNDVETVWDKTEHASLAHLEHTAVLDLPGGKLVVVHGHKHGGNHPDHQLMRRTFSDARTIVYGHSHKLVCDTETFPWVINPGAAGEIRNHGGPSCLVLEATEQDWSVEPIRFTEQPEA